MPPERGADRVLLAAAGLACAPCLLIPIFNSDLFWHLSAAKRILELGSIPAFDWLSEWKAGTSWVDFEWLTQLIFWGVHRAGGMGGLWALKILLLIAAAGVFWKTLALYRIPLSYRAAALAAWFAARIAMSDLRPDLFSVIGFSAVFWALESRRLGKTIPEPLWAIPFFCLWANLHLGVAYGAALIGIYAAEELFSKNPDPPHSAWLYLAAACVGSLMEPSGIEQYQVLWRHGRELALMSSAILEWNPVSLAKPWDWPYWTVLVFGFGSALARVKFPGDGSSRQPPVPLAPLAALLVFGYLGSKHARLAPYYVAVGLPLGLHWLKSAGLLPRPSPRSRGACLAVVAACAALMAWPAGRWGVGRRVFNDRFIPVSAAEFLASQKDALKGLTMYNEWGWGGYLGWRLYPDFRIFQDGRYIFHPLLEEESRAMAGPGAWRKFLDRYGVELALLENAPVKLPTVRRYPDGSTRPFARPFYISFMPKDTWALVYWDDKALVFLRRSRAPRKWLREHEYRYLRPGDEEVLDDVLARREIPRAAVEAERARHAREIPGPPPNL